jgi:hypothetical protein
LSRVTVALGPQGCSQRLPEVELVTFWVSHERLGVPVFVSVSDASSAELDEARDLDTLTMAGG